MLWFYMKKKEQNVLSKDAEDCSALLELKSKTSQSYLIMRSF